MYGFGGEWTNCSLDDPPITLARHEYSVEPEDNLDDPEGHLWEQFGPWLEIPGSSISYVINQKIDCL